MRASCLHLMGGPPRYRMTRIVGLAGIPFPLYPELRLAPPVINVLDDLRAFKPDLIHVINPVSLGYVGLRHARRLRLPLVASCHTDVPGFAARWGLRFLSHPLLRFFRWMHNCADLNLCPSTVTQKQLVAQGCRHVHVWSRGVDNQHTDLAAAYASAGLFVFPAANETLGNAMLEAMSSALTQHVARNTGKHKNFAWR